MCCLISILAILGPRALILLHWLAYPATWSLAFDGPIIPLIGFLFAPWATLTYVFVVPGGMDTGDWVLVGLAFLIDIATVGGGAFGNKEKIPGYTQS